MPPSNRPAKTSRWVARQKRDHYVSEARDRGFRARSVFKLEQIDRKYRLLKPGSLLVDLGAAPGSWSQYAATKVRGDDQIIAVDLLEMGAIAKVRFIRGDFTETAVVEQIMTALNGRQLDLVLSDMAPNISGIGSIDQAHAERLQQAIIAFCDGGLRAGGNLLSKVFAGESVAATRAQLGDRFAQVRTLKPPASRAESNEIYLLARGYNHRETHIKA